MKEKHNILVALGVMVLAYNAPRLIFGTVQYDALEVHYSAQRYLSEELHAGRVPFWTPYIFSGFPFLADLQVGAWYPLNWPFFLIGITPLSINAELLVHTLIASGGAFALGMRMLGKASAAAATAMFYGFSGWFAAHSQHVGMFDTAAWLPWLVLVLDNISERSGLRQLTLAALLGAALALPGHFQVALYAFSGAAVWAYLEAIARRSWRVAGRFSLALGATSVGGGLLSAVMILPAWELVSQSVRMQLNAQSVDLGYFHPASLVTLVYPDYYGLLSGHYSGPGDSTQHYFYAGLLLAPLAVLGLRNRPVLRMAAFLGAPFVWYALGPAGGLFNLVAALPGFSSVELPMHGWFLPALGLALLGGAGFAWVDGRTGRRWIAGLLLAVVLVDQLVVNQLLNPLAYARGDFAQLYGAELNSFQSRIEMLQPPIERLYGPPLAQIGYRNQALQSRVETTYGYNPLELAGYAAYSAAAATNPQLVNGLSANYRLLDDGRVELNPDALPRARFSEAGTGVASVVERGMDHLTVHYHAEEVALLRVSIPMYPGWRANIGALELPITTLDGAFIGVTVPPGEADVHLQYTPQWFWPGATVSALALIGVAVVIALSRPWR